MTQEIITIHSEAEVGISREEVDSVEGKFSKSNLERNDNTKLVQTVRHSQIQCDHILILC